MIRASHSHSPSMQQPARLTRRPARAEARDQARPTHEREHRYHDIRCREADEEIREAFGRFSFR